MELYFALYFVAISVISAVVTVADKTSAIHGKRRISEKTLFFLALIGGGFSMYITMKVIRHKTMKKRFMIGLPLIFMLQILVLFSVFYFKSQIFDFFNHFS